MAEIPLVLNAQETMHEFNFNDNLLLLIQANSILQISYILLWLLSTWDLPSKKRELEKNNTNFDPTAV